MYIYIYIHTCYHHHRIAIAIATNVGATLEFVSDPYKPYYSKPQNRKICGV